MNLVETIEAIQEERDRLREQTRVRDARVEPPKGAVLVYLGKSIGWVNSAPDALYGRLWQPSGFRFDERPYWLPMPPAPEVKP